MSPSDNSANVWNSDMSSNGTGAEPAPEKDYFKIGEVSALTDVKSSVLRFWEETFDMLDPPKSPSGQRLYRQEDVDMVFRIKRLLYDEGFTLAGANRYLREQAGMTGDDAAPGGGTITLSSGGDVSQYLSRKMLLDLRDSLRAFLTLLERR